MRIGTAVLIAASVTLSAQTPQQPPVFRGGADVVEVDVVVHGKDGKFVGDLAADDFVIEEGGRPQPIQHFYLHLTTASGWSGVPDSTRARVDSARPLSSTNRVFIVVFDDVHMTLSGFKRSQAAAQSLFSGEFRAGDVGGVIVRGRMTNNRLTSDRDELLKAVRDAKPDTSKNARIFDERRWPRLSEIEAVRIVFNNDRVVLEEAMRRACSDDPDMCRAGDPEPFVRGKASQLGEQARAQSAMTAGTIRALAENLARVPGRKTILLMSEGFIAEETWPLVQEAVAQAARANARIYTLDARGLERGLASIMDTAPSNDDANARLLEQMDFGGDAMNSLAVDTGGFVVRNTSQFDKAIARIGDDAGNYYVLGYQPTAPADEKFHRIKVTVKRQGVAVRARPGYVATARPAPPLAPTRTTPPDAPAVATGAEHAPSTGSDTTAAATLPDPLSTEARIVPRTESATGLRVRPDADSHARSLETATAAATAASDPDATAGWEAYQRGDVETARAKLTLAAARPSANAWVHYTLGLSSYALRQFREASTAWERVRAASPDFEPVYFDLIDAYLQQKEHDQAIRVARGGIARWPTDPELQNALGVVQTVRGSLDDAVKSFQSAVAIAPQDPTGFFNLAKALELRYTKSRRYVQQLRKWVANEQDRNGAIENYQRYLHLDGPYADAARAGLERLKWAPTSK